MIQNMFYMHLYHFQLQKWIFKSNFDVWAGIYGPRTGPNRIKSGPRWRGSLSLWFNMCLSDEMTLFIMDPSLRQLSKWPFKMTPQNNSQITKWEILKSARCLKRKNQNQRNKNPHCEQQIQHRLLKQSVQWINLLLPMTNKSRVMTLHDVIK